MTSIARLTSASERREPRRRQPDERQALDRVDLRRSGRRARRAAARCRPGRRASLQRPDERQRLLGDSFENATTTRSTSSCSTSPRACSVRAEQRDGRPRSSCLALGSASTKPTRLMPYSGCCSDLARDELTDVAGADDDRVLEVGEAAPAPDAGDARPTVTKAIARPRDHAFERSGAAAPPAIRTTKRSQTPTVTTWKTPANSSRSNGSSAPRPGRRGRRASRSRSSPESWPGAPRTRAPPRSDGARPSRRRNRARRERRSRRARPRLRERACGASASLGGAPCPTRGAARGSRASAGSRTRSSVRRRSTAARTRSPSSFRPCCPHYLPLLSVPPPDLRHLLSLGLWNRVFKARVESPTGDEVAGRSEGDRVALPRNQGANRPSQLGRRRDGGFASATKNPLSPQFSEKELAPESGSPVPGMAESPTPPI